MRESRFEAQLVKRLQREFPGCVILKNDATQIQGIPDRLILHGRRWAALEVKQSIDSPVRPNQSYWIDYLNSMSYASFISPETEEGVLSEIQQALGSFR